MKNLQMSEEAFANEDTFGNVRYKMPLLSCPALYDFSPPFCYLYYMCPPECQVWVNNGAIGNQEKPTAS